MRPLHSSTQSSYPTLVGSIGTIIVAIPHLNVHTFQYKYHLRGMAEDRQTDVLSNDAHANSSTGKQTATASISTTDALA